MSLAQGAREPGESFLGAQPALLITAVKPAGYSEEATPAVAIRAYVPGGKEWSGMLGMAGGLSSAMVSSVTEESGTNAIIERNALAAEVDAGDIASWILTPLRSAPLTKAPAAPATTGPWASRHVAHGQAISPPGGLPLGLRVEVDWKNSNATLHLANLNGTGTLQGQVNLSVADGWSVGPERVAFNLPGGHAVSEPLTLRKASPNAASGAVLAMALAEGETYFDCAREGLGWLDVRTQREEGRLMAEVLNRMAVRALGAVEVASAPQTWPGWLEPAAAMEQARGVTPGAIAIDLPPGGRETYTFLTSGQPADAAIRVAANGHTAWFPLN